MPFGTEKLKWCDYTMVKKSDDMISRLDTIPACDGRTDMQTSCHTIRAYAEYRAEKTNTAWV